MTRVSSAVLLLAVIAGSAAPGPALSAEDRQVKIGVLAIRGEQWAIDHFDTLAAYLSGQIPATTFTVVPMSLANSEALLGAGELDFVITQPANYAVLESRKGLTRIATMRNQTPKGPLTRFGGVVFTRADRKDIQELEDLRGKSFMAVSPRGFGGFLMAKKLLVDKGIAVDDELNLQFCGFPQDKVVHSVVAGEVDAGTVRTQVLERMARDGAVDLTEIRVLDPVTGSSFPFVHSTPLYPEWAFAVARDTDQDLAQEVAIALLSLPPEHPAALAGTNAGWTVPLDYGPVHEVLRQLGEPPYEDQGEITARAVISKYWPIISLATISVLFLVGVVAIVSRLNRRLTQVNQRLETEIEDRQRIEHQLVAADKMSSLGKLAAGIAHEINTPLGYVYSNETTLRRYLPRLMTLLEAFETATASLPAEEARGLEQAKDDADFETLRHDVPAIMRENHEGLRRMHEVVRDIQAFSHVGERDYRLVDLRETIKSTINLVRHDLEGKAKLVLELEEIPEVRCVASRIGQVVMNLLTNARDAVGGEGLITVRTGNIDAETIFIQVDDDGIGMTDETRRRLFDPFYTTKDVGNGTGLGMSLVQRIVDNHDGRIEVESQLGVGTTFKILLPVKPANAAGQI